MEVHRRKLPNFKRLREMAYRKSPELETERSDISFKLSDEEEELRTNSGGVPTQDSELKLHHLQNYGKNLQNNPPKSKYHHSPHQSKQSEHMKSIESDITTTNRIVSSNRESLTTFGNDEISSIILKHQINQRSPTSAQTRNYPSTEHAYTTSYDENNNDEIFLQELEKENQMLEHQINKIITPRLHNPQKQLQDQKPELPSKTEKYLSQSFNVNKDTKYTPLASLNNSHSNKHNFDAKSLYLSSHKHKEMLADSTKKIENRPLSKKPSNMEVPKKRNEEKLSRSFFSPQNITANMNSFVPPKKHSRTPTSKTTLSYKKNEYVEENSFPFKKETNFKSSYLKNKINTRPSSTKASISTKNPYSEKDTLIDEQLLGMFESGTKGFEDLSADLQLKLMSRASTKRSSISNDPRNKTQPKTSSQKNRPNSESNTEFLRSIARPAIKSYSNNPKVEKSAERRNLSQSSISPKSMERNTEQSKLAMSRNKTNSDASEIYATAAFTPVPHSQTTLKGASPGVLKGRDQLLDSERAYSEEKMVNTSSMSGKILSIKKRKKESEVNSISPQRKSPKDDLIITFSNRNKNPDSARSDPNDFENRKLRSLEVRLNGLTRTIQKMETEIEAKDEIIAEFQKKFTEKHKDQTNAQSLRIEKAISLSESLNFQLNFSKKEKEYKAKISELESKISDQHSQLKRLGQFNRKLQNKIKQMQSCEKDTSEELQQINIQFKKDKLQTNKMKKNMARLDQLVRTYERKCMMVEDEYMKLKRKNTHLTDAMSYYEKVSHQIAQQLSQYNIKLFPHIKEIMEPPSNNPHSSENSREIIDPEMQEN